MSEPSVDILENTLRRHDDLLAILLTDHTHSSKSKTHNILWATDSYQDHKPTDEIHLDDITGSNTRLIQPRIAKSKEEQKSRTRDKAEVFTPTNIVDDMNKQIDWSTGHWPTNENNWQYYVKELRLEITCGEAPFIVNRYNAANGKKVRKLDDRVGFLDRKLQTVSKYCKDKKSWIEWATIALQCSYGYEWQGDNLLLARENLLYAFIDYWNDQFPSDKINLDRQVSTEKLEILKDITTIISWNIFQMDGLKYVIPMSCKSEVATPDIPPMLALLGEKPDKKAKKQQCPGCAKNDPHLHNGKYVKIMDWQKHKTVKFVNLLK
jgi:hypothetical protein